MAVICTIHCAAPTANLPVGDQVFRENPDAVCFLGDTPYTGHSDTRWGVTVAQADNAPGSAPGPVSFDRFFQHHKRFLKIPGVKKLVDSFPTFWVFDNHEISSGWDHTPAQAQTGSGLMSQSDTNLTFHNGRDAWLSSHYKQARYLADGSGDVPSEALNGSPANAVAENYRPLWFRVNIDNIAMLFLDCMSGKDPYDGIDNDDPSKVLLGPTQRAWLDAEIVAADNDPNIDFILIIGSKPPSTGDNTSTGQGWQRYLTQLEDIIATYTAAGVTGVFWIGGDGHIPFSLSGTGAWGHDFAGICPGAAMSSQNGSDASVVPVEPPDAFNYTIFSRKTDAYEEWGYLRVESNGPNLNVKRYNTCGELNFEGDMISSSNAWQ